MTPQPKKAAKKDYAQELAEMDDAAFLVEMKTRILRLNALLKPAKKVAGKLLPDFDHFDRQDGICLHCEHNGRIRRRRALKGLRTRRIRAEMERLDRRTRRGPRHG